MKNIPSEPIGSIPRSTQLISAIVDHSKGALSDDRLETFFDDAVKDTIRRFEETGSAVITDGEQRKQSFVTYPLRGLKNLGPEGVTIPFADGHTRQLPALTAGPFRYGAFAAEDLRKAKKIAKAPLKQAVISASAMSLLYPAQEIAGYPRAQFIDDLVAEATKDIRLCLDEGAPVQIDFTEGRLAVKLDPSLGLLKSFIELNNRVLGNFSEKERARIGVHTCPGGDHDSTHSADVAYSKFLPELFQINAGSFYLQFASEKDKASVLQTIQPFAQGARKIFFGVTDPISKRVETAEEVAGLIREIAKVIPAENLGTTDDCGFSPFCDDTSTSRETAFAKIRARIEGTKLAGV